MSQRSVVKVTVEWRRGTAAEWARKNTRLEDGEPGWEKDTRKFKVGDGVTRWNDLEYSLGEAAPVDGNAAQALEDHVNSLTPHPVYDDGPSLLLLYQNAKV